jgi:hypothetical protein
MFVATTDFGIKLAFIIGFTVIFGMVLLLPWTLDLVLSQTRRKPGEAPQGTSGLSRTSMALAVIVVIGFALGYLLVENPYANSSRLANDIVVALTTTLAAIVAFYYGSRSALESAAQASEPHGESETQASESGAGSLAITITSPEDNATYGLNDNVTAEYSASGEVDSLTGTSETGAPIDTSTIGPHTFWVSARDAEGQELAAKTVTYTVLEGVPGPPP